MARLSQEDFEEKFYNIFDRDEWAVIGKYVNNNTNIKILHKPCGTVVERTWASLQRKTCNCPVCHSSKNTKTVVKWVNDIATTNLALFSLLLNKEDGYNYREHSNQYAWFVCPKCGKHHYKIINNVAKQGLSCECCSENISYAEKFFICLLKQLNIDYVYQYTPDWIKPLRYDFYFCLNSNQYIVELDGGLGHGFGSFNPSDFDDCVERDNIKNEQAKLHNHILIRIDCNYNIVGNRYQYIKDNIVKQCGDILDLNKVDFGECNRIALLKNCEYISELWNSGIQGYQNLQNYIPVGRATIRDYLKNASEIGLISESYDEILKINRIYSNKRLQKSKGKAVMCNETGEIFASISEASRQYKKYHASSLLNYFIKNRKYCGTLPDGTCLTWRLIEDKSAS